MAENSKSLRKKLFIHPDGSSICFFMRPCNERQELRPIIEKGGGKVTSKLLENSIKLAEKGSMVSRDGYISTNFIKDSDRLNSLQDMSKYKVAAGTRARFDEDPSEASFGSDDDMSPAANVIQTSARSYKGRNRYTREDDLDIINYLLGSNRYSESGGMKIWRDMEALKVTSHSGQSMNTRYRKTILPNIERYKSDITDKHFISRLTGVLPSVTSTATSTATEPEFSCEALFQPQKKRPLPDSTTNGDEDHQGQKVKLSRAQGQCDNVHSKISDKGHGDSTGQKSNSSKSTQAQKEGKARSSDRSETHAERYSRNLKDAFSNDGQSKKTKLLRAPLEFVTLKSRGSVNRKVARPKENRQEVIEITEDNSDSEDYESTASNDGKQLQRLCDAVQLSPNKASNDRDLHHSDDSSEKQRPSLGHSTRLKERAASLQREIRNRRETIQYLRNERQRRRWKSGEFEERRARSQEGEALVDMLGDEGFFQLEDGRLRSSHDDESDLVLSCEVDGAKDTQSNSSNGSNDVQEDAEHSQSLLTENTTGINAVASLVTNEVNSQSQPTTNTASLETTPTKCLDFGSLLSGHLREHLRKRKHEESPETEKRQKCERWLESIDNISVNVIEGDIVQCAPDSSDNDGDDDTSRQDSIHDIIAIETDSFDEMLESLAVGVGPGPNKNPSATPGKSHKSTRAPEGPGSVDNFDAMLEKQVVRRVSPKKIPATKKKSLPSSGKHSRSATPSNLSSLRENPQTSKKSLVDRRTRTSQESSEQGLSPIVGIMPRFVETRNKSNINTSHSTSKINLDTSQSTLIYFEKNDQSTNKSGKNTSQSTTKTKKSKNTSQSMNITRNSINTSQSMNRTKDSINTSQSTNRTDNSGTKNKDSLRSPRGVEEVEVYHVTLPLDCSSETEDEDPDLAKCVDTCMRFSEEYSVTAEYVRQVLYRCNGQVDRARDFLQIGTHADFVLWRKADDETLLADRNNRRLLQKYGAEEMEARYNFLQ